MQGEVSHDGDKLITSLTTPMLYRRALKAKIHYTSFPVASTQQVRSFSVYGEVTGKRVQWILGINKRYAGGGGSVSYEN